ncbi:hypothetical protein GGR56DRAFT_676773 [Xylariaceae sp. FL0804]|nr:hypothetical protein GGR56DRAFT_676773 [Xylariaceae sp. FL0804]
MTSHDVRDMLNLPAEGATPRPTKKQKTAAPRPNLKGLAREVQNLGGDNPIAIVPEISTFKKRRFGIRKPAARWEMRPFRNSARRDDTLYLRHWRKQTDEQPRATLQIEEHPDGRTTVENGTEVENKSEEREDSTFAKFNVQVDIPQYSEEQYNSALARSDWTKDETDYLFELAKDFDLRWPLIWDRYEYKPKLPDSGINGEGPGDTDPNTAVVPATKARSVEDLKQRYYEVAAKVMAIQKPVQYMTQAEYAQHEVMANFDAASETQRKKFAQEALGRSREEAREEESLLIEVRRILARQEKLNQDRHELYSRLDYPPSEQDINAFKSSAGLQSLLQNLMSVDKTKKRRSIMEANGTITPGSAHPSAHPSSTPVTDNRRDSIAASAISRRDSIGGGERSERPSKKGAQQPERRKLTEQEEQIYGVSHFDRLPSGPTFRYERINKILTTKSHAQHTRITNTLAELDIPSRLNMPTRAVVEEMEKLLNAIGILLDMRKLNDKIDAEIKIEQAKKAEREKALAPPPPPEALAVPDAPAVKGEEASGPGDDAATHTNGAGPTADGKAGGAANGEAAAASSAPAVDSQGEGREGLAANGSTDGVANGEKNGDPGPAVAVDIKTEAGRRKRSASNLSMASDKSAKRLKQ